MEESLKLKVVKLRILGIESSSIIITMIDD